MENIFIRMLSLSEVDWQDWLPQWKLPMPERRFCFGSGN
jgi:hypothetical protein